MSTTNQTEPRWDDPDDTSVNPDQMPKTGEVLGHCRIIDLIAAGGMAHVYKVWHEQLEVVRAVKILKPGFSEEAKNRLETEAKISANLRHPNIVEIYGIGYWKEIPYIEMEYIDGPSLKDLLEKTGRFSPATAVAITHFVCQALDFVGHQDLTLYGKVYDSLVHRDIKPANILINSHGAVKLADFGIARPSDVSLHTVGVKVMGTLAYLSPEQLNGEKLDGRSDIYSLGTVLYEMITGAKAFPQTTLPELIQRKTRGQVIPMESLGIKIPRQLTGAIDKSLMLELQKRYPDALTFDNDLRAVLKRLSAKSPEEIVRGFTRNPPVLLMRHGKKSAFAFSPMVVVGGALLVILIVGAALVLSQFQPSRTQHRATEVSAPPPASTTLQPVSAPVLRPESLTTGVASHSAPPETVDSSRAAPKEETSEDSSQFTFVSPEWKASGVHSYSKRNHSRAAAGVRKSTQPPIPPAESLLSDVRLLESYLQADDLQSALVCAQKFNASTDGYMHFLRGKVYYRAKDYSKALDALEMAQTTPSRIHPGMQRDAVYLWAQTREAIYRQMPNRDNRIAYKKSYQSFLDAYCWQGDLSRQCRDARKKIAESGN